MAAKEDSEALLVELGSPTEQPDFWTELLAYIEEEVKEEEDNA